MIVITVVLGVTACDELKSLPDNLELGCNEPCSQTADDCCSKSCAPGNDVDCCEAATCRQTSDDCCSSRCTPQNDIDCCDDMSCSVSSDGCCPSSCGPENDIDCCDAPCSQAFDGCCSRACVPGDDIDCCEAASCDSVVDSCCPGHCTAVNDQDCCNRNACRHTSDSCCPDDCTFGNDRDCCNVYGECNKTTSDNCCPSQCTPANDRDCCDTECSDTADSCCPNACQVGDDADCCERESCSMISDNCCPSGCAAGADVDCCEAASCSGSADGCCPIHCKGSCDDADCRECTSGDCCYTSTCEFQPASIPCGNWTEYRCAGTGCGDDAQQKPTTQYCSGFSSSCDGASMGSWAATPCGAGDLCDTDNATYAECSSCPHGCGDGACWPACNPQADACCEPDGTMISWRDANSGLCWQDPTSPADMNWYVAAGVAHPNFNPGPEPFNYCSTLGSGWRLPTLNELRSLFRKGDDAECFSIEWDMGWSYVPVEYCGVWNDYCLSFNCWEEDKCTPLDCGTTEGPGAGGCYWNPALTGTCTRLWSVSEAEDELPYYDSAWSVSFIYGEINGWTLQEDKGVRCVR